jgi:Na+/melibiose symporter-like transporter
VVDAVTDPVVARWSDAYGGRLGRRRPFMLWSGLPFVLVGAALFFPPVSGTSRLNALYLGVGLAVFYVLLTCYLVPYAGLLADFSPSVSDRVDLATSNAVYQLFGVAVAMIVPPLLLGTRGLLTMVVVLGAVALCRPYSMKAGVAGSDCPLRPRSLGVVGVCQSTAVLSSIRIL